VPTTVIGVMPPGFRFPVDHHYWIPLRANPLSHERLRGPQLWVFGRLAPGISLQQAQAEFTAVGGRTATAHPALYKGLQPLVLPFTHDHSGLNTPMRLWMYRVATLLVSALTIVVAINLAILVYARTVTRLGEIAVRTALGAGRRRILAQLFIESLALSIVGAGAGLLLADLALDRLRALLQQGLLISGAMAYWIDLELSIPTFVYALALSIVAAFIMGVLPGLQATSGRVAAALRRLDVRSSTRLGPLWTTMVIVQVVVAVAVLPMSVYVTWQVARMFTASPAIEAEKFAVARVAVGGADVDANRVRARQLDFTSRLIAEPGVVAVTYSSGIPGFSPGRLLQFVAGQPGATSEGVIGVDSLDVAPDLFDVYGARTLAGRSFTATDLGAANAVVVNRTFVNELLNPSTALGARFRYTASTERPGTTAEATYEIVGIVSDFPGFPPEPGSAGAPTVYHPARPGDVHPFALSVRFTDRVPDDFPNRLRTIGAEVDPAMQLQRAALLTDLYDEMRSLWRYLAWGIGLVTLSVLLLSAAGIYAMMSFTIAQRTREIAIRMALGAAPHRLLLNTFSRVAFQLGLGVAIGTALSAAIFQNDDLAVNESLAFVSIVAAIMTGIGVFAAVGPARRGLRIEASEALKAE
jgi:predicted permease